MSLSAGITYLTSILILSFLGYSWFSFKYSNLIQLMVIVTKLKWLSQPAGNFNKLIYKRSSETLCDKSILHIKVKKISVHVPIHSKPLNDIAWGHYLAGLIDGDGHFSKTPQLVIAFNQLDSSLAYYIKSRIGYGNVYKIKNKKAIILVISNKTGLIKVLELIKDKIRSLDKLNQIKNNILSNSNFNCFSNFNLNSDVNLNNHWLAGFADADASFQIKLIPKKLRTEVRLNFQIDQKKIDLLNLIKNFLGGNVGYRKNQDSYYYSSTSFGSAIKVIHYFDKYHLLSSKHINYLKWRKAYLIIQKKEHLNLTGLEKITKLKFTMNSYSSETLD